MPLRRLLAEWMLIGLAALFVVIWAADNKWTGAVNDPLYSAGLHLLATPADDRIIIVDIDDESLAHLGRWPWSRDRHRELFAKLAPAKPRVIGYDVLFLEPSGGDEALAAEMRALGSVYLPGLIASGDERSDKPAMIVPVASLRSAASGVGSSDLIVDPDGVVRAQESVVRVNGKQIPQMTTLVSAGYRQSKAASQREPNYFRIPYVTRGAFRHVPFLNVVKGEIPSAFFADRIVLVGATAQGLGDIHPVPPAAGGFMPGVEIQANVINALLNGSAIRPAGKMLVLIGSFLAIAAVLGAFITLRPGWAVAFSVFVVAALCVAGIWSISFHLWWPPGAAIFGILTVVSLWGWRRLATMSGFLTGRISAIAGDEGIQAPSLHGLRLGDPLTREEARLHDVIDQLRDLRGFVSEVVERLPDATCVVGEDGTILLSNAAAQALFDGDVVGRSIDPLLEALTREAEVSDNHIILADGTNLSLSDATLSKNRRVIRLADITAIRRADDEREEMLQFLSHDLRAPHAAILTMLETPDVLRSVTGGEAPLAKSVIERIRLYARHGLNLADDFVQLARARRRQLAIEIVDLCDVVREAYDMVWAKALARSVTVDLGHSDNREIWVNGDRAMLLRAVINLLDNAIKFAPQSATVEAVVTEMGDCACLSVRGPGPRMPLGRANNPFAVYGEGRDVGEEKSTGLGLAFVLATATRHGGNAEYQYVAGIGPEFSVTIRLAPGDDQPA